MDNLLYYIKKSTKMWNIAFACLCVIFYSCKSTAWVTQDKQILPDQAIDVVIDNFLRTPEGKNKKVDEVTLYIWDIDSLNIRCVSTLSHKEDENKWPLNYLQEHIGQSVRGIPTEYRERSGILFCWTNPNVPLTQEMIDILNKYGRILESGEDWLVITGRIKRHHIYFCKSNYKKYKKRFTVIAKPPCMNCQ